MSDIIQVSPDYRVEPGPRRVTAVATKELLDDARTADHYKEGLVDANGNKIVLGKTMDYIEWGGREHPRDEVFNVYKKTPVDATAEKLKDGSPNPYFVPEHMRERETDDRTFYTHVWALVHSADTSEDAIAFAKKGVK